jgi:dTDP-4-dehydrorhamnose 3,5-epimerase-like enzyme
MSNEIELTPTALPEVLIINSNLFNDDRGNFSRAFDSEMFKDQLGFQLSQINIFMFITIKNKLPKKKQNYVLRM